MAVCPRALVLLLIALSCDGASFYDDDSGTDCQEGCNRLSDTAVSQHIDQVLVAPLLVSHPEAHESERWPEYPTAIIESMYRGGGAQVNWLRGLHTWDDYYREAESLTKRHASFDRVIFIGHGGYDGPILNPAVYQLNHEVKGDNGRLFRAVDSQPGLRKSVAITYNLKANPLFSRYVADSWHYFDRYNADVTTELSDVEKRLQAPDRACLNRCQASAENDAAVCQSICSAPLFLSHTADEIAEDRFNRFVGSLRSLTRPDGLIVLGFCNGASAPYQPINAWDFGGLLVRSKLAGGPHDSYMQLLAAATGRAVAGAVGQTSADDIVKRVAALERNHYQRFFKIAVESQKRSW